MMENFRIAIDFAKKIRDIKGILQIVLFGSVARNEDRNDSDIDIAVIHNLKDNEKLKSTINKVVDDKIQVVYIHVDRLPKETELISAITGEGILLYGKPIKVIFNKKVIEPFVLIVYDTTNVEMKKRMLLNRALHGSTSISKHRGKTYRSEKKGIVQQPGITKLAKACIVAEPKKAALVKGILKRFGAEFKEELIWK